MYKKSILCLLLLFLLQIHSEVLVTIESQSQEEMDQLTEAVDTSSIDPNGPMRTTLGAIEATMSRVVDVDSPYLTTVPQSMPTLTKIDDIAFDEANNVWTFKYKSMAIDPSNTVNSFNRILYLSKNGNFGSNDNTNPCLSQTTTNAECLTALETSYFVPQQTLAAGTDYLTFSGDSGNVQSTVTRPDPTSLIEEVVLTIPHSVIRDNVARRETTTHPTEGVQIQYTFGIGMAFVGEGNNMIIFDTFTLIENNREQVAITRLNTYAVAKHVSFWTQQVQADSSIRLVHIEYLLDTGYSLSGITASINGNEITTADCDAMQAKLDAMENSHCITSYPVCSVQQYSSGTGDSLQSWASYTLPLPVDVAEFKINTLLTTKNTNNEDVLSTLNFITSHNPQVVCKVHTSADFNPIDHVSTTLYRGHSLVEETISGTFNVENATTAVGLPDTLMTLVLKPKDADGLNYFTTFTDEYINLDEVYISHAKDSHDLPQTVTNAITGSNEGRSLITLDANLLSQCPLEVSDPSFSLNDAHTCITTKDWSVTGQEIRPKSSPNLHFVRRITNSAADLEWLKSNIFAGTTSSAQTFLTNTEALVPANERPHAQIYYVWPVYLWPDESPIGLKDKSIVSFTWSVTKAAPPSPQARRLLTVADDIFHVNMETHPLILDDVKTRRSMKKIKIPFLNAPMPAHKKYQGLRYRRSQVMDNETKTSDIAEDMRLPCCFNYTFA